MIVLDGLVKTSGHSQNLCIRILGIGLSWKHFNVMPHDRKGLLKFSLECIIVSKIVKSAGKIRVYAYSLFGQLCRALPLVIISAHGKSGKPVKMLVFRIAGKQLIHRGQGSNGIVAAVSKNPFSHEPLVRRD